MTFRAESRASQWASWLVAALVALAVYVVLSRLLYGSVTLDLLDPLRYRLAMPLVVLVVCFAWETRWDGIVRKRNAEDVRRILESGGSAASDDGVCIARPSAVRQDGETAPSTSLAGEPGATCPGPDSSAEETLTGAELFVQARSLRHGSIPDFAHDGSYLALLGKSAAAGYAPALAKLGEYAMRRAAWVEAYYWMVRARRTGMRGLLPTLRKIRKHWADEGFPGQVSNVNRIFTAEDGSIGRALLRIDSGYEAASAKEFLKANHPEYL